jgi:hypothetical protein
MVATNDDLLKELTAIKNLLSGFYGKEAEAKQAIDKDIQKII